MRISSKSGAPHRLRQLGAAAALALSSFMTVGAYAQDAPPPPGGRGMHGLEMRHGGPSRMIEHMLDRVKATPEQHTKVRTILDAAAKDMQAQGDDRQRLHGQQLALLAQPKIDAQAAESLRQQMMMHQEKNSKRWLQAMLDVAAVLTPEQRAQLAEQMAQRQGRHGPGSDHVPDAANDPRKRP